MRSYFLLACVALTGCVGYVQQQPVGAYDGNPCNDSYFDAIACQTAVQAGGWYLGGSYYRMSGGYGYDYYSHQHTIYIQHGGRVTPYRDAVRSVGSAGKYVPPSQRPVSSGQAGKYTPPSTAGKPYTAPSRPSSSYSPPSRPSSSYSSPSRSRK